ncbi:hypothetical protein MITS9509_01406 [Synechococcus sp. MIT S9509]|uniref:DUF4359 domain-containing protein n=1 Tax=unclassified Synechococcus TaxID=2626047 RepID=UPI0007BAEFF3|nr:MULTISPECIES: DUF4359 domain-containing protein [unclassified Synechococcus]KZR86643.1 hypothetical protein MITS9504_01246 [Synechococcus sp. MIT S9504]KZR92417.1 hypothetical protein MITS9509_01406 [Synechococcus sp. MIT S9509]
MSSPRWRWPSATATSAVLVLVGSSAALIVTNPTREDYRVFAGETLAKLATKEICERQTLPMVLQLWISDCPRLIADQEQALALLADQFTRRWNLGLASVYTTTVGGQNLLPALRLPRYSVTSLGLAGQFLVLNANSDAGKLE